MYSSLIGYTNMNRVQPPANGKKLWRVKNKSPSQHESNTIACLQNSLRITASGKKFSVKKPQLKRPKNKPGCPRDFVFVDLSPVKEEDNKKLPPSPVSSVNSDEFSNDGNSDTSFDTSVYDFDLDFDMFKNAANANQFAPFCQPIDNVQILHQQIPDVTQSQIPNVLPKTPIQKQFSQFQTPVQQILKTPEVLHQRSSSVDNAKSVQFKPYTPKKSKPSLPHRHTVSEPVGDLDDFMSLNNQIVVPFYNQWSSDFDHLSDCSSIENSSLSTPLRSGVDTSVEYFEGTDYLPKQDFDFESFLKI